MKKNIIFALILLIVGFVCFKWGYNTSSINYEGQIAEFEQGSKIDFKYINELAEFSKTTVKLRDLTGKIAQKVYRNDTSEIESMNKELDILTKKYDTQYSELESLKKQRSELYKKFKHVSIIQP